MKEGILLTGTHLLHSNRSKEVDRKLVLHVDENEDISHIYIAHLLPFKENSFTKQEISNFVIQVMKGITIISLSKWNISKKTKTKQNKHVKSSEIYLCFEPP